MHRARTVTTDGLLTGKLPPRLLERLLRWRGAPDRRVLVGPGCGVDAAVVALGRHRLILKSDPVTFTAGRVGWYVVQVNANDVAVMGGRPAWFQPTILVPPGTHVSVVMTIARDIDAACRALGVAVTGGHTEVTDAVTRPVVAGDMQGPLVASRVITAGGARPGDLLLLTKAAGIEGTAVLAQERAGALGRALPPAILRAARRLRYQPGISVVPEALIAARHGASAMHDPTEGGIRAGLHEIAFASGARIDVDLERIPILPPTARICSYYGIDPLGLIGSGALLVAAPAPRASRLLRAWARHRIAGRVIGSIASGRGVRARLHGRRLPFPWVVRDEIITALERASTPAALPDGSHGRRATATVSAP
ncbi:MAG TPA: AIR synthase family protein [Candidatus Acidoferrum sp.]|jgi:hydrogenase expression/formation protein HypE|nr:AIR synthase family protein [Candidatus Acidoferrum sp.]